MPLPVSWVQGLHLPEGVTPRWLCKGFYRPRWQYLWPWALSEPWRLSAWRGKDEYCNPSIVLGLPFLGAFVVFYERELRTVEDGLCEACLAENEKDRLDGWTVVP